MAGFLQFILTYGLSFLAILTVVVTIHELGHFWAARTFGVAIDRFSIGFGKPIAMFKDKQGVEWRIGWIPLGGYVRFGGDTNDASLPDGEYLEKFRQHIIDTEGPEAVQRYHHFKPVWQRAIIAAAGPVANFILAFLIFCMILLLGARYQLPAVVSEVAPDTPAAVAGFEPGDRVLRANGRIIDDFQDLRVFNGLRAGNTVTYLVDRGGEEIELTATLVRITQDDQVTGLPVKVGQLGVRVSNDLGEWVKTPPLQVPGQAAAMVVETVEMPIRYIGRILTGRENGDQLSGILGIATTTGKVAEQSLGSAETTGGGVANLLFNLTQLTAFISVAIGFVNLLPIPILDGGHLMFYAYEAVARKPVGVKIQEASYRVGLALVLGLMLFATWNDLQRLQAFKFLGDLLS